ncbi:Acetate kinase [bioreactor metagenome]|uniref:Acetate kinase n=1 Tax=bioreactor metagenome TaxID=1076179 RepID=A0A644T630_9ZZZZ|nr:hypothetical protein [Candidatus Elulimicrobiales bacterium]
MKKNKGDKIIMVSNIGSASRKYFVYSVNKKEKEPKELFSLQFDEKEYYPNVKLENALYEFFEITKDRFDFWVSDIDIIAERVVATGEYFLENKIIDEKYLDELEDVQKYDPLHTASLIDEIQKIFLIKEVCEKNKVKCKFKLVGISDSVFHSTISPETYTYGIPKTKNKNHRKFGYHGISMSEVNNNFGQKFDKIIAIHLGGGGSVTAIKKGESVYNSFGMTPVSGLINLTRVGDVDPFLAIDLAEEHKKFFRFLSEDNYLFKNTRRDLYAKSGLFSLTGERDMRDILANLKVKDENVKEKNMFALEVYMTKINECVGSAYAHLGGCDALVLTGAILEKSDIFRKIFLPKLKWLKVKAANIFVLKTEEEKEIARLVVDNKFV